MPILFSFHRHIAQHPSTFGGRALALFSAVRAFSLSFSAGATRTSAAGFLRETTARTSLLILLVLLGCLAPTERAAADTSRPERIDAAVEDKAAQLKLTGSHEEFAIDKARRVREAITRGDYESASETARQVLAGSRLENWHFYPFEDFMTAVSGLNEPAFDVRLNEWVTRAGNDQMPILIRSQYHYDLGRLIRGGRFSRDVLPEHQEAAASEFSQADQDVEQAIVLDEANPYPFLLRLRILRSMGRLRELPTAFDAGQRKHPGYYQLYEAALATLQPKWGGSVEAMHSFVTYYTEPAPSDSPLKLLNVSLYRYLMNAAYISCYSVSRENGQREDCITSALRSMTPAGLEERMMAAMQLYNKVDKLQFSLAVWEIVSDMLNTPDADRHSGAFLQVLASSMGSDTTLEGGGNGKGNFMVDLAVGKSWYRKGFYENAAKKAEQGVSDAEAAFQGSDPDRRSALSLALEELANSKFALRDFEDAVTYSKLARRSGGSATAARIGCYAFVRLKDHQSAIPACSDASSDQPSDVAAIYMRGYAAQELKDEATAVRDLEYVAGSENDLRAGAAIELSMIHFGRKDLSAALSVLQRHRYLYDPRLTERSDVAVAYNNLCYALMEMKANDDALDACTQSLKFGNIPDAYRKQQELVRMKAQAAAQ